MESSKLFSARDPERNWLLVGVKEPQFWSHPSKEPTVTQLRADFSSYPKVGSSANLERVCKKVRRMSYNLSIEVRSRSLHQTDLPKPVQDRA